MFQSKHTVADKKLTVSGMPHTRAHAGVMHETKTKTVSLGFACSATGENSSSIFAQAWSRRTHRLPMIPLGTTPTIMQETLHKGHGG